MTISLTLLALLLLTQLRIFVTRTHYWLMFFSAEFITTELLYSKCPWFVQDSVNFHQKPGGDTAGPVDPNWPNRTGYLIPCDVILRSEWGSWTGGS